jgi:hypothetical protein
MITFAVKPLCSVRDLETDPKWEGSLKGVLVGGKLGSRNKDLKEHMGYIHVRFDASLSFVREHLNDIANTWPTDWKVCTQFIVNSTSQFPRHRSPPYSAGFVSTLLSSES